MIEILSVTLPVYLLILLGYGVTKGGMFAASDMKKLGLFVIRFTLPAMIFKSLSQTPIADILNVRLLLIYALGSLLAFAWGWFSESSHSSAFRALRGGGMSVSNSGFIGTPIVLHWLGPASSVAIALALVVENILILPLMLILAERDNAEHASVKDALIQSLKPLLKNPLILAIVFGFLCALFEVVLPKPMARVVDMLAASSAALSLMVVGGALVGLKIAGLKREVSKVALGKLLVHPLCVGILVYVLLPHPSTLGVAAITLAAMPMMSIYPIFGQKYGHDGFCAAVLLGTIVTSFFTLIALISFFNAFVPL